LRSDDIYQELYQDGFMIGRHQIFSGFNYTIDASDSLHMQSNISS